MTTQGDNIIGGLGALFIVVMVFLFTKIVNLIFRYSILILIGICSVVLCSGLVEGEEKDSLLMFTCEELEKGKISTDGKGGRFVTDIISWGGWIGREAIMGAMLEKGCITQTENKFHYASIK